MAVAAGYPVNIQEVVNRFISVVHDPAYNSAVYWNTNLPPQSHSQATIDSTALSGRTVSKPNTTVLKEYVIPDGSKYGTYVDDLVASAMVTALKRYANYTTVYRRARYGLKTSNDGAVTYYGTGVSVCRLTYTYQLNYSYSTWGIITGSNLISYNVRAFLNNLRSVADAAQDSAAIVDLRVCHSSCHDSCHGSRGRR